MSILLSGSHLVPEGTAFAKEKPVIGEIWARLAAAVAGRAPGSRGTRGRAAAVRRGWGACLASSLAVLCFLSFCSVCDVEAVMETF